MRVATLTGTDMMLLAGTRVALGVGIGLLVSPRLDASVRRGAGFALLFMGAITTVPIMLNAFGSSRGSFRGERAATEKGSMSPEGARRDSGPFHGQPAAP
ncbi:MAG TPA: hypothetical protein VF875_00235 [Anaeromyxobacter sp.]